MKLDFKDIIGKHKGQKCLAIGHGPSLNKYINKLDELKEKGYKIIGCNDWKTFYPKIPPDYWIIASTHFSTKKLINDINKYNLTWVYANSLDVTPKDWVHSNIKKNYLPYDQRHYGAVPCGNCRGNCKLHGLEDRLTIQEELKKYTNYESHYGSGDTVMLHSIALSVLLGFSEIYVIGMDLNYRLGYAKNNSNRKIMDKPDHWDHYTKRISSDLDIIKASALRVDTKIINLKDEGVDI
jgi:hypothetical protein